MSQNFADRLVAAVQAKNTATLVGLDPRRDQLPQVLQPNDGTPENWAAAYQQFCCAIIDVVAPLVPAVKPQAAFFEELGPAGMTALYHVIQYARQKELLVILDGKRNDIGSTATGYAKAYLAADSVWQADALTVSPYLGDDSLTPFVDVAESAGTGIFVLVKTSNPGGAVFQDLEVEGRHLYQHVGAHINQLANSTLGENGYGAVGAVVGATYPEQLIMLREQMPQTWFLIPGFGAQGGGAADVKPAFDDRGLGALINSSRGIIFAYRREPYQQSFGEAKWEAAVEASCRDMIAALRM